MNHSRTIHVVTFDPFEERAAVGGFNWFFSKEGADADEASIMEPENYIIHRFEANPADNMDREEITAVLDRLIWESEPASLGKSGPVVLDLDVPPLPVRNNVLEVFGIKVG